MDPIGEALKDLVQIPDALRKAETHCFDLSRELLKDSEHFKKTECHFEAGSLVNTYLCSLDNRSYTVTVTPSKEEHE
jgi:hypothetical protein